MKKFLAFMKKHLEDLVLLLDLLTIPIVILMVFSLDNILNLSKIEFLEWCALLATIITLPSIAVLIHVKKKKVDEEFDLLNHSQIKKKRKNDVIIEAVEYHYIINDKHYCFTRGQMVIVKEMKKPTALGDILYNTEMEVSQIGEEYITLLNHKETSGLTGGSAEYCFPIKEIGKIIFPQELI